MCSPQAMVVPEVEGQSDDRSLFFDFISTKKHCSQSDIPFSMCMLHTAKFDIKLLLQVQQSLWNMFIDRLRTASAEVTLAFLQSVPYWCGTDILVLRSGVYG